jgi:hypothetical protein
MEQTRSRYEELHGKKESFRQISKANWNTIFGQPNLDEQKALNKH